MPENSYISLYVNVESAQVARSNVKAGINTILNLIKMRIIETYGSQDPRLKGNRG